MQLLTGTKTVNLLTPTLEELLVKRDNYGLCAMKKTTKKLLEHMGQKILVTRKFVRCRNNNQRYWEIVKLTEPRIGWVVGFRWLQTGVVYPPTYLGSYSEPEYDPGYLRETYPRTQCVLVAFWPTEKPIRVPMSELCERDFADYKPYTNCGFGEGIQRKNQIAELKAIMKSCDVLRDAKGRFVG